MINRQIHELINTLIARVEKLENITRGLRHYGPNSIERGTDRDELKRIIKGIKKTMKNKTNNIHRCLDKQQPTKD